MVAMFIVLVFHDISATGYYMFPENSARKFSTEFIVFFVAFFFLIITMTQTFIAD